jgi:hypothetical protein
MLAPSATVTRCLRMVDANLWQAARFVGSIQAI